MLDPSTLPYFILGGRRVHVNAYRDHDEVYIAKFFFDDLYYEGYSDFIRHMTARFDGREDLKARTIEITFTKPALKDYFIEYVPISMDDILDFFAMF